MKKLKVSKALITEQELRDKVVELAQKLHGIYQGREVIAIGILKGCFVFMSDLVRAMSEPVKVYFMEVSSYGNGTKSSGVVEILKDIGEDIKDKDVLIVEDIVDSGNTLSQLKKILGERQPKSLRICTMLSKPSRREVDVTVDAIGFEIPDEFVVGYGLDCAEQFRNLPYIGVVGECAE